jgi:transcriptional regulator GlxA family with amidase domain
MLTSVAATSQSVRIGVLPADRQLEARVREATRFMGVGTSRASQVDVIGYAKSDVLCAALRERAFNALVIAARDSTGQPTHAMIERVRASYPRILVIGYITGRHALAADALMLGRAGVHELVLHGVDDVGFALRRAFEEAARYSVIDLVERALQPHVPASVWPFVRYCLTHLETAPSVAGIAAALGVHRKTLANWMRAAAVPPPRTMAMWCRLLVAVQLLQDTHRPVEQVAHLLDFPSANAFRNALRRYAGVSPSEARSERGLAQTMACMSAALRRAPVSGRAVRVRRAAGSVSPVAAPARHGSERIGSP